VVPQLGTSNKPLLNDRRSFVVEDIRVDTQLLDEAKARYPKCFYLYGRCEFECRTVLVRMSRGGQAVPISSVIDSYRESPRIFPKSVAHG